MYRHFKPFGISIFALFYDNRFGWFRVFGRGLKWKDTKIHCLTFSERNGYSKAIRIGCWRVGWLKKESF